MRLLMKEKKKVKENLRLNKNEEGMVKLNELKEKMLEEEHERYYRRLMKTCEEISRNGKFDSGNFLKVKKRMERKKADEVHGVRNKDGVYLLQKEMIS